MWVYGFSREEANEEGKVMSYWEHNLSKKLTVTQG